MRLLMRAALSAAAHAVLAPAAKGGARVVGPQIAQQLEAQLGYCPLNALDVVATTDDAPAVVVAHPLLHRKGGIEPFPTTYWLAHSGIAAAVATVEASGGVGAARTAVFEGDDNGADALARAHAAYAADRWALLDDDERTYVLDRGWDSLKTVGVAGIRDRATIKCLHAHYAHFFATRANPVGAWVHAQLPLDIRALCPESV
jgi:hypothetical protein